MRTSVIILSSLLLSIHLLLASPGMGQGTIDKLITLNVKELPLRTIFRMVEEQSGMVLMYESTPSIRKKKLSFSVSESSLPALLDKLLGPQSLKWSIRDNIIRIESADSSGNKEDKESSMLLLPPVKVKGKLYNKDSEPVEGATIAVKGSAKMSVSNEKGEFTLDAVDDDAVLVISGVNIQTREYKLAGNTSLLIMVKERIDTQDEVVVTSLGIEKNTRQLGYSVAKIKGEELNRAAPPNLLTGLTGKVAGLNISTLGSGVNPQMRVLLRGIRSIGESSNNLPLFVLNGVPLSFGADVTAANLAMDFINNINPMDIEEVSILKGANGAALYGPEGVNGVILITTKKGTSRPQVTLRHSLTFQQKDYRYPKEQQEFGAGGAVDAFGNGIYTPYPPNTDIVGNWGARFTGEMVPLGRPDEDGNVQMVPYRFTRERERFWDIAQTNQTDLSLSRSDDKFDFYLGLNNTIVNGLVPKDQSSRHNVLMNMGADLGNGISTRVNFGYTRRILDVTSRNIALLVNSTPAHVPLTSYEDFENNKWANRNYYFDEYSPNPYEALANNRSKTLENALFGNLQFIANPFRWMKITERLGINFSGRITKITSGELTYNDFAKSNGRFISSVIGDQLASVTDRDESNSSLNNDILINTEHKLNSFTFKTTLGHSISMDNSERLNADAYQLAVPVYNLVYSTFPPSTAQLTRLTRTVSTFGSVTTGYKDRIFMELTARQDWDSKVARVARDKSFYYGANASLVMNEIFPSLKNISFLSEARLRAAVNRTANMNITPYQSETLLELTRRFPFQELVSYELRLGLANPLLIPENIISQEYGTAISLFNNNVKLDASYYRQVNNGLIVLVPISRWTGFSETTINAGKFTNYGYEVSVQVNSLFKSPNFNISAGVSYSMNDNKVNSLGGGLKELSLGLTKARVGGRAYEYSLYDWRRDPEGRIIVDPVNGLPAISFQSPVVTGRTLPKHQANLNLHFSWKGLGLHVTGEYRGGYDHYFRNGAIRAYQGTDPISTLNNRERFVVPNSVYDDGSGKYIENEDVVVQSVNSFFSSYSTVQTNAFVSGAFMKLRELVLSYDIPEKMKWINKITVSATARNLFMIYPKSNIWGDPELVSGPGTEEVQSFRAGAANNTSGAYSDEDVIGGTRFYGLNLNLVF